MKRVVITGVGMVSPLANGVEASWKRLLNCESGIGLMTHMDVSDLGCKIAGLVPLVEDEGAADDAFDPEATMPLRERKRIDKFILYGIAAADEALADSGWKPESEDEKVRTGVLIGSGIGGLQTVYDASITLHERGPRKLSPFTVPSMLINLASGQVSIRHGLKGPNHAVVTACSTGAHAIGDATEIIKRGDADVMVAGGAEAAVTRLGIASFLAARALSTGFNETPEKGSRPYDQDRDGFVMGEGAGCVILEDLEHAQARGAKIYAEVIGYGLTGDAHHITAPADDGDGGFRSMSMALGHAGLKPGDIDYVNAHGTSTPKGDEIELRAVERLFGDAANTMSMSATKSAVGHLLGAAGAIEAIFSILAIRDQIAPPTLNLDNPSCETTLDLVPHKPRKREINTVLSNSFGFGGTNASLIMRRFDA